MEFKIANGILLKWLNESEQLAANPPITYIRDKQWIGSFLKENESVFKKAFDTNNEIAKAHFELDETGRIKREDVGEGEEKKNVPVCKEGMTEEMYQAARNQFLETLVTVKSTPTVIRKLPFILRV